MRQNLWARFADFIGPSLHLVTGEGVWGKMRLVGTVGLLQRRGRGRGANAAPFPAPHPGFEPRAGKGRIHGPGVGQMKVSKVGQIRLSNARLPIFNARRIAPEQPSSLLHIALAEVLRFAQFAQSFSDSSFWLTLFCSSPAGGEQTPRGTLRPPRPARRTLSSPRRHPVRGCARPKLS